MNEYYYSAVTIRRRRPVRNCIHGLRKNNIIVTHAHAWRFLRHFLQNVANGTYTRLHTLISYVLLITVTARDVCNDGDKIKLQWCYLARPASSQFPVNSLIFHLRAESNDPLVHIYNNCILKYHKREKLCGGDILAVAITPRKYSS